MNIYIKGNDIVSIRGKVWGKIFTRKDGKVEIDTVSPLSTCYCLVAEERLRTYMVLSVMERFQQLTTQEMKWMRKNHGLAMKFIARQFEENSLQEGLFGDSHCTSDTMAICILITDSCQEHQHFADSFQ